MRFGRGFCLLRLIFVRVEPVSRRVALPIVAIHVGGTVSCDLHSLLDLVLLVRIDLAICLVVDWRAFSTDALRHTADLWSFDNALVVEDSSDAVIIRVTDVDFDVAAVLVVKGRDAAWLIET